MTYKPPTVDITAPADAIGRATVTQALGTIRMAVEASEAPDMGKVAHVLTMHLNELLSDLHWDGEDATVAELHTLATDNGLSPMGLLDPR